MAFQVKSFKDMKMTIQIGHLPLEGSDPESGQKKRKRTDSPTRSDSAPCCPAPEPSPRTEATACASQTAATACASQTAATACASQTGATAERQGVPPVSVKQEPVWDDSLLSSTGFSFCQFSADRLLTDPEVTRTDAEVFRDLNASSVHVKTEPGLNTSSVPTTEHAVMPPPQAKEQTLNTVEQCSPVIKQEPESNGLGLKIVSVSSRVDLAQTHFQSESEMTTNSSDSRSAENSTIPSKETLLHGRPASAPLDANKTDRRPENDGRPRANSVMTSCSVRLPLLPNLTSSSALQVSERPVVVKQEVEENQHTTTQGSNAENHFAGHLRQDQFCRPQQAQQPKVALPTNDVNHLNASRDTTCSHNTNMDVDGDSHLSVSGSEPRRKKEETSHPACVRGLDRTARHVEGARDVHGDQPAPTDMLKRPPAQIPVLQAHAAEHREVPPFCTLQNSSLCRRPPVSRQTWVAPVTGTGTGSHPSPSGKPSSEQAAHMSHPPAHPSHPFYDPPNISSQGDTMVNHYPSSSVTAKATESGDHQCWHQSFLQGQPDVCQVSAKINVQNPHVTGIRSVVNLRNILPKDNNVVMNFEKSAFSSSNGLSTCTRDALSHSAPGANPPSQCVAAARVHHQHQSMPGPRLTTTLQNAPASIPGNPDLRGVKHQHHDCQQSPGSTVGKKPQHVCGVCRKLFTDRVQCILHVNRAHVHLPSLTQTPLKEMLPVKVVVQPQQRLEPVHPADHRDRLPGNVSNTRRARTQNRNPANLSRPGTLNLAATDRQKESAVQGETRPRGISHTNSQTTSSIRTAEKRPLAGSSTFSQIQTAASTQRNAKTVVCSLCSRLYSDDRKVSEHLQATLQRMGWYYCLSCKQFITDVEEHLTQDDLPHQIQKIKQLCAGCGQSFRCILDQGGHAPAHMEDRDGNDCAKGVPPSHRSAVHQNNFRKDHRCLVCGDSFFQLEYLKFHMRKHSGDRIS